MNKIIEIQGVRGRLNENGFVELSLEDVARGLGFMETKGDKEYVMWRRVDRYLSDMGFSTQVPKDGFIPENIFYKLCFKASNETARRFQDLVTDEILPAIRKYGGYLTPSTIEEVLLNPDTIIRLATQLKAEKERNAALVEENESLEIALNESLKFYTVAKYNKVFNKNWGLKKCKEVGKRLSAYCRARAIEIRKCQTNDERFGKVNSYPLTAWESFCESD